MRAAALVLAMTLAACAAHDRIAARPSCDAPLTPAWSSDSIISLCLPPGFLEDKAHVWARMAPEGWHIEHFRILFLTLPRDSAAWKSWPPRYETRTDDCGPDCVWAESIAVRDARIDGAIAHIQTALVSGGIAGWHRDTQFLAAWEESSDLRIVANGWSRDAATLDTLLMIIRSTHIAKGRARAP